MPRIIIKKPMTTEKGFKNQDKGIWSFLVARDANKIEIKQALEHLFGVKVDSVNTSTQRKKIRRIGRSRIQTKRQTGKVARVSLKKDSKKFDFTKTNKK